MPNINQINIIDENDEETVSMVEDSAARAMVSDAFIDSRDYVAGEYCIYNDTLYIFTDAKEAGAWDESKVASTTCAEEFRSLNSKLINNVKIVENIVSMSLVAGGYGTETYNISSIPDGYKPIDAHVSKSLIGYVIPFAIDIDTEESTITIAGLNTASMYYTTNFTVKILCVQGS